MQIPSHTQEGVQLSYGWFCSKIPVFNMLGKEVLIDKSRFVQIHINFCKHIYQEFIMLYFEPVISYGIIQTAQ